MDGAGKPENEWFVDAFSDLYPLLYAHRDEGSAQKEAEGLRDLLGLDSRESFILDACCGAGRHAAAFVEMGYHVIGFDLSPVLLAQAMQRESLSHCLARADMRSLPFQEAFDVILSLFTSFGYFADDRDNEQALHEMARVLRPGGRLIIDHIHRLRLERTLVPHDRRTVDGHDFIQSRRFEGNRIVKEIEAKLKNGECLHVRESVRLYEPHELKSLLNDHGFGKVRFCGGFSGEPLTPESDRMIVLAEKGKG
ncbi:MAG: class I SAM-dependent methyltransferase [Planctomycetota bacterium]